MSEIKLQVVERARLGAFRRIKWLDLSHNQIAHLDVDTFSDLKNLRYLYLNNNAIRELEVLPQGLFRGNPQLQLIRLDGNLLKELHVDLFKGINYLEEVSLYENQLEDLPPGLFRDNQQLQQISLNANLLTELHVDLFKGLKNLENLFLFGLFRDNPNMKIIQLEGNEITSDQLHHLFRSNQQLQEIGLNGNYISEIPADLFEGLHSLAKILLNNNNIASLPQGLFRDNYNLIEISLEGNRIKKIETDFSHLSKLKRLNMLGNVCIAEDFKDLDSNEINNKIRTKCSN